MNANAAIHFVDRHPVEGRSAKVAFIQGEKTLSYGDLAEQTDRMIGLCARLDLRREDRAAMIVLDGLDFPVVFWGALKAGIVPVAINTMGSWKRMV